MNDIKDILKKIENHENRITKLEKLFNSGTETEKIIAKKISEREFLRKINPRTVIERSLALSYYLEVYGGKTSFNIDDLKICFKAAKEPLPKNLNDMVNRNISKGLLMKASGEDKKRKYWELTQTGLEFIDGKLKI